jgi:threonine/homoserine/homoserine lactone efflux protein
MQAYLDQTRQFIEANILPYFSMITTILVLIIVALLLLMCYNARHNKSIRKVFKTTIVVWIVALVFIGIGTYMQDAEAVLFMGVAG